MLGSILIVDPVATNRIALRAKFGAAQYKVLQAATLVGARRAIEAEQPDLVLTCDTMPDGTVLDLLTQDRPQIPIVVYTDLLNDARKFEMLHHGADDVIVKPVSDTVLFSRIQCLVRRSSAAAAWRLHDGTSRALGASDDAQAAETVYTVRVLSNGSMKGSSMAAALSVSMPQIRTSIGSMTEIRPIDASGTDIDAFVIVASPRDESGLLRAISGIRCHRTMRYSAVFVMLTEDNAALTAQLLDLGADDVRSVQETTQEFALRLSLLMKDNARIKAHRKTVLTDAEAAMTDPLTGLHNRRYAEPHLQQMLRRSQQSGRPLATLLLDLDLFKSINDQHGHKMGDAVLVETADRLRDNLRASDMIARFGGEEFVIAIAGLSVDRAVERAEELCAAIGSVPFQTPYGESVSVTASIGVSVYDPNDAFAQASIDGMLQQADEALYRAKSDGRNRVNFKSDRSAA